MKKDGEEEKKENNSAVSQWKYGDYKLPNWFGGLKIGT